MGLFIRKHRGAAGRSASRPKDPSPRELVLGYCLFLLGSWMATLQIESPTSAARWMFLASVAAVMLLWPALRLSQDGAVQRTADGALTRCILTPGMVFLDWLCLALVFQSTIWPLRITGGWESGVTLWLDLAVLGWTLLTGLVVAVGCQWQGGWARAGAMGLCVLIVFGEPLAQAVISGLGASPQVASWTPQLSPIGVFFGLLDAASRHRPADPWRPHVMLTLGAAAAGWTMLAWVSRGRGPSGATGCGGS